MADGIELSTSPLIREGPPGAFFRRAWKARRGGVAAKIGGIVRNGPNKGKPLKLGNHARISAAKQPATRARAESVSRRPRICRPMRRPPISTRAES